MSGKIDIKCIESVKDIDPDAWDFSNNEVELFHSLEFLEVLENAKVENSTMLYLMAIKEQEVIATAVLSIFKISLDLFIGDHSLVKWINNHSPDFFKITILFCGTPVSIGHKNLMLADDAEAKEILSLFEKKMKEIAAENNIKHLITKELDDSRRSTWGDQFLKLNWFEGYSIPDVKMKIRWKNYEDYLKSMRYSFRRQINSSLLKMNNGNAISNHEKLVLDKIQILRAEEVDVKEFFEKYLKVMDRAAVKLETLNLAFFEHLFKKYHKEIRIFSFTNERKNRSYFFTIHKGKTLYFLWTARNENKDPSDVYFNLYQAMICYSIEHKVKLLHLGQTAYYAKMRIGGIPQQRFIYYKCLNFFQHLILKSLRHFIFPELKLKPINVFQSVHNDQKN
jgi:predicted N-acyltransferase